MIENECTPAVIVVNPKAVPALLAYRPGVGRSITMIVAVRAGFHGVFKIPTKENQ